MDVQRALISCEYATHYIQNDANYSRSSADDTAIKDSCPLNHIICTVRCGIIVIS